MAQIAIFVFCSSCKIIYIQALSPRIATKMPVRHIDIGRNEQGQFELVTIPEWLTESGEPIFNLSISRAAGASSQTPMLESMLNSQSVVSTSTSAEPRGQVNTSEQVGHIVFFCGGAVIFILPL